MKTLSHVFPVILGLLIPFGMAGTFSEDDRLTGSLMGGIADGGKEEKWIPTEQDILRIQNYPNPFNPVTRISFILPSEQYVTLAVHNILGEEVRRVVEGYLQAGSHVVRIDARTLPSGVYFYRLTTDQGITSTKRMILMK